jgi:hypothetical protein
MIPQNKPTSILYSKQHAIQPTYICISDGCSAYPFVCCNIECRCMTPHRHHQFRPLQEVQQKLHTPPTLPEQYVKAERSINGLIHSYITAMQYLQTLHNEHIERHMLSHRKYEQLRWKLVSGDSIKEGEVTGDTVSKMLKEIEEVGNISNPYCLPSIQIQQYMDEHRKHLA